MKFEVKPEILNNYEKVFITYDALETELASRVQQLFPKEKIHIVDSDPYENFKGTLSAEMFDQSKKMLLVTPFKGQFFKRCPGATQKKTLTCCNYYVLNLGSQCNMNCSYCYLQNYLNSPITKLYSNIDKALQELEEMAVQHPDMPFRVGTGEITDSLSLDEITLYSRKLINFFKRFPNWMLEFKTKSNTVDQFLDLGGSKNIIVSWSINPQYIIGKEEHGTASLQDRITAAKKCLQAGFSLALHIDPLIWHPEWKENYKEFVELLLQNFKPDDIQVISIGALRLQPEQRQIMKERFGLNSLVTSAEMFPSEGAKLRYDFHLRNEMFQFIIKKFKSNNDRWNIFLCMETPETWIQNFNTTPMHVPGLKDYFRPLPKLD